MNYRYDGTFDGLLCVLSRIAADGGDFETIERGDADQVLLFSEDVAIATVDAAAEASEKELIALLTPQAYYHLYACYLSELKGIDADIARFVQAIRKRGKAYEKNVGDPAIFRIVQVSRKVRGESHRLKGLLRFQELKDGMLYAMVEPDHNIITLLAPHFARRYGTRRWMIHDRKRGKACLYENGEWMEVAIENAPDLTLETGDRDAYQNPEEAYYKQLWKTFYKSIAIKERKNDKLRQHFMPKKYWKYLIEMEKDEEEPSKSP